MKRHINWIPATLVVLVAAMPAAAQAPAGDDLARCEELYAKYVRYSNPGGEGRQGSAFSTVEAQSAVEQCRRGNTREGIAVLERKLRALGFKI
jgi:hypothetical protein